MTVDAERRKKLRKKPLSLVYVELPSANGGMMRDLSEDGFAMRAMIPLRAGQQTSFVFSLDEFTRIEGEGVVEWIEENGRIAGVKFVEIPASARDKIDEWLLRSDEPSTQEQDAPIPHPPAPTMEALREEMRTAPPRPVPPRKEEPSASEAKKAVAGPPPQSSEDQSSTQLPDEQRSAPEENSEPAFVPEAVEHPVVSEENCEPAFAPEAVEHPAISEENSEPAFAPEADEHPAFSEENSEPAFAPEADEHPAFSEENSEPAFPRFAQEDNPAAAARSVSFMIERRWRMPDSSSPTSEAEALEDSKPPERGPNLPDISSILMQPPGVSSAPAKAPRQHLSGLDGQAAEPRLPWTEELTLSSAISIMFILALTVGIYVFHGEVGQGLIWLGERMGGRSERTLPSSANAPVAAHPAEPLATAAPAPDPTPSPSVPASSEPAIQEPPAADSTPAPAADPPPSHSPPTTNSSPGTSASSRDPGQSEYLQAEQLLRANSGVGTGEAVQLLWISVEKGNPYAEIALADLYWHGRGVPKNCDQTRILLAAAARKGNPEARRRLEQFQQEGCE
jgi:hypothetical protein